MLLLGKGLRASWNREGRRGRIGRWYASRQRPFSALAGLQCTPLCGLTATA